MADFGLATVGMLTFTGEVTFGPEDGCELSGTVLPASTPPWAPERGARLSGTYSCGFADGMVEQGTFSARQRKRRR